MCGPDKVRPLADIPASVHMTRTMISPVILPVIMSAEFLIVNRRSVNMACNIGLVLFKV